MKNKKMTIEEEKVKKQHLAENCIKRYKHASKPLYKAILAVLPDLKNVNGTYDDAAVDLAFEAGEVMDSLGELSRKWSISVHWLYTVCNPNITDEKNVQYSPMYRDYGTTIPSDQFGELKHLDDDVSNLVAHGNKLLADKRYVDAGIWSFGTSWNDAGEVISQNKDGHPIFDNFTGWVVQNITTLEIQFISNKRRDRHFQAFLIAHTRDVQTVIRNSEPEHKPSHLHGVLDLPTQKSRYQIMMSMGVKFDDYTRTFKWLMTKKFDDQNKRVDVFLRSLKGLTKNYVIPDHYQAALQYLVHQSKGALKDQKTVYKTSEVISWLPDDPNTDFEHIAGVYNNETVSEGKYQEVEQNLHSPYNTIHHMKRFVGHNVGDKIFTIKQLAQLRKLGIKRPGKISFTGNAQNMIIKLIMTWIRQRKLEVNDWGLVIHAAFDDNDADNLLSDQNFKQRIMDVIDSEINAMIHDDHFDRKMTTIFITAATGGIGKTRLATELAKLYDKGRMPHYASAKDEGKTYDPYQNYANENSSIVDEIDPNAISWAQLKDLLDPHKVPVVSSRFIVKIPWNVHHTFMTNVYKDGISSYIRQVLHYAPGVSSLGYLKKDGNSWHVIMNDQTAGNAYLSQLSQLLRRIPYTIHLAPTANGLGTRVTVSVINFKPGGRVITDYDYVHTPESDHIFRCVINDDLSDDALANVTKTVVGMINKLQGQADAVFDANPNTVLNASNGFIESHCDFGVQTKDGIPYLGASVNDHSEADDLFRQETSSVRSTNNLISRINSLSFMPWDPKNVDKAKINNEINQLDALFMGLEVPIYKYGYDTTTTIRLTDAAKNLINQKKITPILLTLNSLSNIDEDNEFLQLRKTDLVAGVRFGDEQSD